APFDRPRPGGGATLGAAEAGVRPGSRPRGHDDDRRRRDAEPGGEVGDGQFGHLPALGGHSPRSRQAGSFSTSSRTAAAERSNAACSSALSSISKTRSIPPAP